MCFELLEFVKISLLQKLNSCRYLLGQDQVLLAEGRVNVTDWDINEVMLPAVSSWQHYKTAMNEYTATRWWYSFSDV